MKAVNHFHERIQGHLDRDPHKTIFHWLPSGEGAVEEISMADLDQAARAIAVSLQARGLGPGRHALLLCPPGPSFIYALFGCFYAGVTAVPAYPPLRDEAALQTLTLIARQVRPDVVLGAAPIKMLLAAAGRPSPVAEVPWLDVDALLSADEAAWVMPKREHHHVALLQYTSGSTRAPRAVMLGEAQLIHNCELIRRCFDYSRDDRGVSWLPPYHDMGLVGALLQPVHLGSSVVLMSPLSFLEKPVRWLWAMSRFNACSSGSPNFGYEVCVRRVRDDQLEGVDLSAWRIATNGAEPIRSATLDSFAGRFAAQGFRRSAFYPCYGLAEATLLVSGAPLSPADHAVSTDKPGVNCGVPWQPVRIVDPKTGTPVAPGEVGEVWVSGPGIGLGYWTGDAVDEARFQAVINAEDGTPYLRTGDLGYLDDGCLHITGRLDDLIIIHGRNHYPQDLELTAEQAHEGIRQGAAAAFSVADGEGQRLVLCCELQAAVGGAEADALCERVRQAVYAAHGVRVDDVVLTEARSIPKTTSGKIRRRATRDAYCAGTLRQVQGAAAT